jgi:hypothetical protein
MTGIEIAVGYLFAWAVRKVRRVAGQADAEVDRGLDAAMERLHDLVSTKLGNDPALQRAQDEADAGQEEPHQRTRQRLQLALEDAVDHDADFAQALAHTVTEIEKLDPQARHGESNSVSGNSFQGPTAFQVGNDNKQDNHFGKG